MPYLRDRLIKTGVIWSTTDGELHFITPGDGPTGPRAHRPIEVNWRRLRAGDLARGDLAARGRPPRRDPRPLGTMRPMDLVLALVNAEHAVYGALEARHDASASDPEHDQRPDQSRA